ncbi:bifunctional oligoribonuclease/PAP phosphatase NrnA [Flammeovirga yaeyamensis]|uniref:Bifunctional oligoribonuclease/PAP phosphatase NrnA n=1 Tax=Flammeovirga yaeyamensis TaxID=367791 RepID=A0AAX1N8J4_9BACT|nr:MULTISPECIES: bifunctional oligoribonuclease/PAP phosphatase NrnA [Flammeovirga]ANQ50334.1 bifunctional oligoribonuclease/PAP phosphatase NrnA [Flammeovirga sp. MY04]MBB3699711.1 phosphoesterase RecJ-like protein [Flammeovirga yaeyamensis]NMF36719.1 bifunctional oligoribonuclease/PAP phosphatase NrnA [Flammeovirga yaeyamensis]QWG02238.1 bifunctional oligoribonuclease/PAP phosphatase NrnA [Flammeovirga yaeyamensis]
MHNFNTLKEFLEEPRNVVIIPHTKPDADAIGSALGLSWYLRKFEHTTTVLSPNDYPSFLHWMPGHEEVVIHDKENAEASEEIINNADAIFCVDFSALSRIEDLGPMVEKQLSNKTIVMIDHHRGKVEFADYELWDIDAAAAAQLIYEFIDLDEGTNKIDQRIAACLYAGIVTDTGSFKYPSVSSRTLRIAAALKDTGLDTARLYNLIYDNNTETRLRFLGHALKENLTFWPELNTGFFTVSQDDRDHFKLQSGDTEGLVNYALSVNGIKIAAIFKEKDERDGIKVSLRSIGDFSVADLAAEHFNGGGHKNAAGGRVDGMTIDEAVVLFKKVLEEKLK